MESHIVYALSICRISQIPWPIPPCPSTSSWKISTRINAIFTISYPSSSSRGSTPRYRTSSLTGMTSSTTSPSSSPSWSSSVISKTLNSTSWSSKHVWRTSTSHIRSTSTWSLYPKTRRDSLCRESAVSCKKNFYPKWPSTRVGTSAVTNSPGVWSKRTARTFVTIRHGTMSLLDKRPMRLSTTGRITILSPLPCFLLQLIRLNSRPTMKTIWGLWKLPDSGMIWQKLGSSYLLIHPKAELRPSKILSERTLIHTYPPRSTFLSMEELCDSTQYWTSGRAVYFLPKKELLFQFGYKSTDKRRSKSKRSSYK